MTELNAKDIIRKYKKTNRKIMRNFEIQRNEIKRIEKFSYTLPKYNGALSRIFRYLSTRIKDLELKIKINEEIEYISEVDNDLISRIDKLEICDQIKRCFLLIQECFDENLSPDEKIKSIQFLRQSIHEFDKSIQKIPEFAISDSR